MLENIMGSSSVRNYSSFPVFVNIRDKIGIVKRFKS